MAVVVRSLREAILRTLREIRLADMKRAWPGGTLVLTALLLTLSSSFLAGCRAGPTSPTSISTSTSTPSLPLVRETASMRYYHESGDTIDFEREEAFTAWALERLGLQLPRPVEYRKYVSREAMQLYTGQSVGGFAEPALWRFHTVLPFDNHEVVHVYTAMIGRPSDFFNEGIAVSFQVDPGRNDFTVRFGGFDVDYTCRASLAAGALPLPLSRYVTTDGFRSISPGGLAYQEAGSFVLYLTNRFGLPAVLEFFRSSSSRDSVDVIQARMQAALGLSIDQAEADWLAFLRQ